MEHFSAQRPDLCGALSKSRKPLPRGSIELQNPEKEGCSKLQRLNVPESLRGSLQKSVAPVSHTTNPVRRTLFGATTCMECVLISLLENVK